MATPTANPPAPSAPEQPRHGAPNRAAGHAASGRKAKPRRRKRVHVEPGSLVADPSAGAPSISLFAYGPHEFTEVPDCDLATAVAAKDSAPVVWIDVVGLGDVNVITRIGEAFGLHPLALEDVLDVHHRPKIEAYDEHLFAVLRMVVHSREPLTEQVSLFVGTGFVISFQEHHGDCLESVRVRLRHGRGRMRHEGGDYLAYALIDSLVDAFFPVLESYGEEIEALEDAVVANPRGAQIERLHRVKRDLLMMRRAIWPTRDLLASMLRDGSPIIGQQTGIFLRDVYDHTIQLIDLVETYREIASGLVEVYLSSQGARMNEIMKVLTVIATIFMPLSFLVGLWGMNFDTSSPFNMPELGWRYGYPFALGVMAAIAIGLIVWFGRRGWLKSDLATREPPLDGPAGRA